MSLNIFARMELLFWNLTIQALSQSDLARTLVRRAYNLTNGSEVTSLGILMGATGIVGLVCGYLFYFLTLGVR
jgi:hypothetical protein